MREGIKVLNLYAMAEVRQGKARGKKKERAEGRKEKNKATKVSQRHRQAKGNSRVISLSWKKGERKNKRGKNASSSTFGSVSRVS